MQRCHRLPSSQYEAVQRKNVPDAVDVVDGWTGCRLPEAGCRSTPAGGGIRTEAGMGGAGALCATEAHTWRFEQKKKYT